MSTLFIFVIKLKNIVEEVLNEWHEKAKLEARYEPATRNFKFFRNGLPAGEIRSINSDGHILGFGVQRSLQGTGIGKAMLHYAFEKTHLPYFTLDTTSANAFYHKIGGIRSREHLDHHVSRFTIEKDKLKPSPFKFQDINLPSDKVYNLFNHNPNAKFDIWPSIN